MFLETFAGAICSDFDCTYLTLLYYLWTGRYAIAVGLIILGIVGILVWKRNPRNRGLTLIGRVGPIILTLGILLLAAFIFQSTRQRHDNSIQFQSEAQTITYDVYDLGYFPPALAKEPRQPLISNVTKPLDPVTHEMTVVHDDKYANLSFIIGVPNKGTTYLKQFNKTAFGGNQDGCNPYDPEFPDKKVTGACTAIGTNADSQPIYQSEQLSSKVYVTDIGTTRISLYDGGANILQQVSQDEVIKLFQTLQKTPVSSLKK